MIALDKSHNLIENFEDLFEGEEFLVVDDIDNLQYHFEPYSSNKLLYLKEKDLIYFIKDLEKGIIIHTPRRTGKNTVTSPLKYIEEESYPDLKKILSKAS